MISLGISKSNHADATFARMLAGVEVGLCYLPVVTPGNLETVFDLAESNAEARAKAKTHRSSHTTPMMTRPPERPLG